MKDTESKVADTKNEKRWEYEVERPTLPSQPFEQKQHHVLLCDYHKFKVTLVQRTREVMLKGLVTDNEAMAMEYYVVVNGVASEKPRTKSEWKGKHGYGKDIMNSIMPISYSYAVEKYKNESIVTEQPNRKIRSLNIVVRFNKEAEAQAYLQAFKKKIECDHS